MTVAYQSKHLNTINKNRALEINSDKSLLIIKKNIMQKIKQNTRNIFQLYSNKIAISKQFHFIKWKETSKNQKYIEGLKSELDKKIKSQFDAKMDQYDKLLKKLNQESKEFKTKMDCFEKNILTQQKIISEFDVKEKEFLKQKKLLAEDTKKKLDNLLQTKNELKENYSKVENYVKELEKTFQIEIENQNEKEMFLNNYINEMNSLLDFYEMKSSKFFLNIKY